MQQLQAYTSLIKDVQSMVPGEQFYGYLPKENLEKTHNFYAQVQRQFRKTERGLNSKIDQIAQNESIETLNTFNQAVANVQKTVRQLTEEIDSDLYGLKEVPLKGAYELLQADKAFIQKTNPLENAVNSVLENPTPENIQLLYERSTVIKAMFQDRRNRCKAIVETIHTININAKAIDTIIDKRKSEKFASALDYVFEKGVGIVKPYLTIFETFKEHQVFVQRRAERTLERDDFAIKFFEEFERFIKRVNEYIDEYEPVLHSHPQFEKLKSAENWTAQIEERKKEIVKTAGLHDHTDAMQEPTSQSKEKNFTLVYVALVIFVLALGGFLIYML